MADERQQDPAQGPLAFVERVLHGDQNVFVELLEQAADNVVVAAELLHQFLVDFPDGGERATEINDCEHRGDEIAHELINRLNRGDSGPIERKDLLALISALDDIVDLIDEVAAFLTLYAVEAPMMQAEELATVLLNATRELCRAVHKVGRLENISALVVEVHRLENEGDRIVRGAIASLFEEGIDPMVVIRWKDIFERLEDAIDSTERAAYVLEGVVVKHS